MTDALLVVCGAVVGGVLSLTWQGWRFADLKMRLTEYTERDDRRLLEDTRYELNAGLRTPPEGTLAAMKGNRR